MHLAVSHDLSSQHMRCDAAQPKIVPLIRSSFNVSICRHMMLTIAVSGDQQNRLSLTCMMLPFSDDVFVHMCGVQELMLRRHC